MNLNQPNKAQNKLDEIMSILSKHRNKLEKNHKVKEIGIFGSYALGNQKKDSDIDIIVDFDEIPSLLKFVNLQRFLQQILMVKVDLVRKGALRKELKEGILEEATYL